MTQEFKHTPEPWRWQFIGTCGNFKMVSGDVERGGADAPNLYKALKNLMRDIVGGQEDPHGTMKAARDALAEVEGK